MPTLLGNAVRAAGVYTTPEAIIVGGTNLVLRVEVSETSRLADDGRGVRWTIQLALPGGGWWVQQKGRWTPPADDAWFEVAKRTKAEHTGLRVRAVFEVEGGDIEFSASYTQEA